MCVYIYIHTYAAVEVMPTENLKDKDSSPYLPHSTPLSCRRMPDWASCVIQQLPTRKVTYFIHDCVYMSVLLS